MKCKLTLIGLLMAITVTAQEENQFTIDAQLRTRGEINHGSIYPRKTDEGLALFANERARLSLGYIRDRLEVKLSAQHAGVWGQDAMNTTNGRVSMNEAWAKLDFGQGFFAQVGRQQLSYDDERILGSGDWNVAGNWHDALRLGYDRNLMKAHAVISLNQNGENIRGHYYASGAMPYKALALLWWHLDSGVIPFGVSLMGMNLTYEGGSRGKSSMQHMQTFGTHLTYAPNSLDFAASFYVQTGKNQYGYKVSAFMGSFRAGVTLNPYWQLHAGYDYLSGNDGRNTNQHAFDPLYGTHHKFYGAMDYFTGSVNCGLQDITCGVTTNLSRRFSLGLDYHGLLCAEKIGNRDKMLGHELDLQASWTMMPDAVVTAGYSRMFGTETMDAFKGGNHKERQDWLWLQLNVSTRLFSTKWK